MSKSLRKAIMTKTKQAKKDYFNNLDVNKLNFWKTIKPYFSDKGINSHNTY